jgi:DNA polymerase-3 subunit gamma/tau
MVSQSAQVASVEAGVLKIAFDNPALASRFGAGPHSENLALAVRETLGLHVRVEPVVGPPEPGGAPASGASGSAPSAATNASSQEPPLPHEAPADHEDISDDDVAAPTSHLTGADVIASMLGGTIVEDDGR